MKIPSRRKWQPTPVFLPKKSHGQRSMGGYSPWGCKRVRYDLVIKQQLSRCDVCVLSRFSHVWVCNPMDHSLPGSSVHGLLQARILEWITMPSSRKSSRPRDWTCIFCVSCIAGRFFSAESPGKLPRQLNSKESAYQCRRCGSILESRRSLGVRNSNSLQYSS